MLPFTRHHGLAAAAAGAATLLAAAPPAHARPRRCRADDLTARLGRTDAGAGQRFATLSLRNRAASTCRTYGYVGMRLRGQDGAKLPTNVVRVRHATAREVYLQPGDRAFTRLRWGAIAGSGETTSGPCEPTPARLEVTPPDDTHQLHTAWRAGPVCQHGRIETEPLRDSSPAGSGAASSGWPIVRRGDRGAEVRAVQRLLDAHGRRLAVDGIDGPGTTGAVRTFQSARDLATDGVVGPRTWDGLVVTVSRGSRGDAVLAAQRRLRLNDEDAGRLDGVFGPRTARAVRSFQRHEGLHVDGIAGPRTWRSLLTHGTDREGSLTSLT